MNKTEISVYDQFDYDYSKYWRDRKYEHEAERLALKKLLKNARGTWFADLGGSYGRHVDSYYQKFHNCVIVDYSMKALKQARERLKENQISNVELVAANVYNLPFKNNVFDGTMMVRVIHHLEKPQNAVSEVSRIIQNRGIFILEYANKKHIKAIIKAIIRFDFNFLFSSQPYKQPTKGNQEGTDKETEGIIYNFASKFIKRIIKKSNFKSQKCLSVSFYRVPFLKKVFPEYILSLLERLSQFLFSWSKLSPSIFLKNIKIIENVDQQTPFIRDFDDTLCCPKCRSEIKFSKNDIKCTNCSETFPKQGNIYDLRYPKPSDAID